MVAKDNYTILEHWSSEFYFNKIKLENEMKEDRHKACLSLPKEVSWLLFKCFEKESPKYY